jgi:hypothetical protein
MADRRRGAGRRFPVRELAVAAFVVANMVVSYRAPHRSSGQPAWKATLAQARTACATRRPFGIVTLYGAGPKLTAVVPVDPPNVWYVPVRCARLD